MMENKEAGTGGPHPAARPSTSIGGRAGRRRLADRLSRLFVTSGGVAIIASILAIMVVILLEILPLFRPASVHLEHRHGIDLKEAPMAVAMDEYRERLYVATAGGLKVFSARDGAAVDFHSLPGLGEISIRTVSDQRSDVLGLGLDDGRVLLIELRFPVSFEGQKRIVGVEIRSVASVVANADGAPVQLLAHAAGEREYRLAAVGPDDRLTLIRLHRKKSLIGGGRLEEVRAEVTAAAGQDRITALGVDNRGDHVFAGTSGGEILRLDWKPGGPPKVMESVQTRWGIPVTVLSFLLGDRTLVAGYGDGGVTSFQMLPQEEGGFRLTRIREFAPHGAAVAGFCASTRNKGFLTWDAAGQIKLRYGTTGADLLTVETGMAAIRSVLAPRGDGIAVAGREEARIWRLKNPHPEITFGSIFGKVWYEGYSAPEYVWQSTGATDDFESKYSLTPLIFGTLKGTFYALIVAIPIALLSALYVSQFLHPFLKGMIKPLVEVMAALPSVVLGFVAGLWLAPRLERVAPGLFLSPLVLTILVLGTVAAWRRIPLAHRQAIRPGMEVLFLVPVVVLGLGVSFWMGGFVEAAILGGDYLGWLLKALGLTYDQRNSLVVGIAMGFAVIPIIFTIAEDSLSNVPPHLAAGSLALGATRWQTAVRVVLPTASPGIFSAVMIGLGRAVGETMIVLMATGNTPLMDFSPFNGFRALSANIAVELPEAPEGSTHFRVLFLSAFLLFLMTFVVNTAAEAVRLKLRKRYQCL